MFGANKPSGGATRQMTESNDTTGERDEPTAADVVELSEDHPVVLFDGVCNLCVGYIQFLIERDPEGLFRFAPLQSAVAEELLSGTGLDPDALDSIVLVEDGKAYVKSDAVIRIGVHLGGAYRLLGPTKVAPRRLRNAVYDLVAENRYDWFGQKDQCMMPTPELEARFLAGDPMPSSGDT